MLLAGHPQMTYYGLLMLVGQAAWLLVKRWQQEGRRAFLISLAGLAVGSVIGSLLAAVYLLPLMEFTANSTRQLSVSSTDTYPLRSFLHSLVNQQPSGPLWEGVITPGLVVLALALTGVAMNWRKAWPLALGVLLVAGLAMGNSSPFYLLVARVLPDFDRFRSLVRIWFVALVMISLLAGLGADSLMRVWRPLSLRVPLVIGTLIVLVVAYSLVAVDRGDVRVGDVNIVTEPSHLARIAAQLAGSGRIYDMQENILQASAVQLQVRLADGWDPLLIESYVSYMQRAGGYSTQGYQLHIPYDSPSVRPNAVLLGLMNVSVVVSRRPQTDTCFVQMGMVDGTYIYKNTADAGPGYLVKVGPGGNAPSLNQTQRLDVAVDVMDQTPELSTFAFSTSTEAYFVVATPAFPGWTAELDGRVVPVEQIAGVLPAIKVGPGKHILSYRYTPSSVRYGAILSLVGLLAALACFIIGRFWKPGKPLLNGERKGQEFAHGVAGSVPM
jgi:hypothetical protein